MFGFGTTELLLFLLIVLVVFGAGKLPQVGRSLGGAITEFKQSIKPKDEEEEEKDEPAKKQDGDSSSSAAKP